MKPKMNHYLIAPSFLFLSCFPISYLTSGPAVAGGQEPEIIEVMAEDFVIGPLDISHLENGDSETVFTEDGRTIDILRSIEGIEIFIDGEPLGLPSLHHHEGSSIELEIECISDDHQGCSNSDQLIVNEDHDVMVIKDTHGSSHHDPETEEPEHRKVIIIKEIRLEEDEV